MLVSCSLCPRTSLASNIAGWLVFFVSPTCDPWSNLSMHWRKPFGKTILSELSMIRPLSATLKLSHILMYGAVCLFLICWFYVLEVGPE